MQTQNPHTVPSKKVWVKPSIIKIDKSKILQAKPPGKKDSEGGGTTLNKS